MVCFSNFIQIPDDESGDVIINPDDDDFPEDGLPGVVEITVIVSGDADISDLWLHACNEPRMYDLIFILEILFSITPTILVLFGNLRYLYL